MVVVRCPGCATRYRVPEKLVNQKVKCKKCGQPFRIAAPPPEQDDDLLGALAKGEAVAPSVAPPTTPPAASTSAPTAASQTGWASAGLPDAEAPAAEGFASYLRDVGKSLLFFTRGGDLVTFVIVVIIVCLQIPLAVVPLVGILLVLIVLGWYMAFQLNTVLGAAGGEQNLPELSLEDWVEGIIFPLLKWLMSWLMALVPFAIGLAYLVLLDQMDVWSALRHFGTALRGDYFSAFDPYSGGSPLLGTILLIAMAVWPMMLLVVAVGGVPSLVRFDLMALTIIKTLPAYILVVLLAYVGVVGPALLLAWRLSSASVGEALSIAVLGPGLFFIVLQVYANIFAMRVIGLYYHHFKQRFAWSWG
ncbi:MAG: MJ0042-type zinc finger domain-containing protein [Phycisphaerae bacterium]